VTIVSAPAVFGDETTKVVWGHSPDDLDEHVADGSVDLLFADPPYNIGKQFGDATDRWPSLQAYAEWCRGWIDVCLRKMAPTGSLYVMTSTQAMPYIDLYLRERVSILSRIVWCYDSSGVQARSYFGSLYEPILFGVMEEKSYTFNADEILVEARTGATRKLIDYRGSQPKEYSSTKVPGNVWQFPRVRYRMPEYENHPAQKPEALIERIIRASSNPGDLVVDPFAGTFTTSAVAQRLERRSVGIERVEEYIGIGLRRLDLATHLNGAVLAAPKKNTTRRNGRLSSDQTRMELA
jgi:site-specific DNA-methyltransferase (adenine-specific)